MAAFRSGKAALNAVVHSRTMCDERSLNITLSRPSHWRSFWQIRTLKCSNGYRMWWMEIGESFGCLDCKPRSSHNIMWNSYCAFYFETFSWTVLIRNCFESKPFWMPNWGRNWEILRRSNRSDFSAKMMTKKWFYIWLLKELTRLQKLYDFIENGR